MPDLLPGSGRNSVSEGYEAHNQAFRFQPLAARSGAGNPRKGGPSARSKVVTSANAATDEDADDAGDFPPYAFQSYRHQTVVDESQAQQEETDPGVERESAVHGNDLTIDPAYVEPEYADGFSYEGEPVEEGFEDVGEEFDSDTQTILVLDRRGELSLELAKSVSGLTPRPEVLRLSRPTQLLEVVSEESPHVIVVAPTEVTQAGLRRLAQIHNADPRVVILLSENGKPMPAARVADAGVSGILPARPTRARLHSRLVRALEIAVDLRHDTTFPTEPSPTDQDDFARSATVGGVVLDDPVAGEPAPETAMDIYEDNRGRPAPVLPMPSPRGLARVFTVSSASGGSGKTFVATNLAAYLATAFGGKVLLVDLDLQFGEVAVSLQLPSGPSIAELLQEEDLVSALGDYLLPDLSGFKVLSSPKDPLEAEGIGVAQTTAVLDAALGEFDFIVVDTPSTLNDTSLGAIDRSEALILLANMDLPSLKQMQVFMRTLKELQTRAGGISLILNKAESNSGIDLEEVEAIYPQPFLAVLPATSDVLRSINTGRPVLQSLPHAEISRMLAEAFMKLAPPPNGVSLPWTPKRRLSLPRALKGRQG